MAPISLSSNLASLKVQGNLSKVSAEVARSSERLSSGMRINRASDDAAGLSIASKLNSDARIFGQAIRNVNDGVSALTIADQAIGNLSGIVTRLKELATQSANGVYSGVQRQALDSEAQELAKEYNRILETTSFNDIAVLSISGAPMNIQVEAGSAPLMVGITSAEGEAVQITELVTINENVNVLTLDGVDDYATVANNPDFALSGDFTLSAFVRYSDIRGDFLFNTILGRSEGYGDTDKWMFSYEQGNGLVVHSNQEGGAFDYVYSDAWNADLDTWYHVGVTRSGNNFTFYVDGAERGTQNSAVTLGDSESDLTIGFAEDHPSEETDGTHGSLDDVRIYSRALSSEEMALLSVGGHGVATNGLAGLWKFDEASGGTVLDSSGLGRNGSLVGGATRTDDLPFEATSSYETFSLESREGALAALDSFDTLLSDISSVRSRVGSQMSRLEVAFRNLVVKRENYKAAESRIVDADIASETGILISNQIKQQAAASILANANQQPALALQLLR